MRFSSLKKPLCLLLTGMISVGTPLMAAGPVEFGATDVALADGVMEGTVLNASAQPVSGLNVQLLYGEKVIATATSDENGQFAIRGLRNGGHVLQVGSVQQPVRFWGNQAAPPSAASKMAIVVDQNIVRGQDGRNSSMTDNLVPWLIFGGALGATLAITLSQDDPNPIPASP
jgi:hypothetical protein